MMKVLLFTALFIFCNFSNANINLRSLKDVSVRSFDFVQSKPTVYMIFQEDCSACIRQVKELSCISWPIYLLGAFSTEKSLRKEYRKMETKYPVYLADNKALKELGVSEGLTPQTVAVVNTKKYHFLGLSSCEKIKSKLVTGH